MIYHVTTRLAWEEALQKGFYETASLAAEGFIHTSSHAQVQGVLNRYYKDQAGLLLMHIDESLLTSQLKYEPAASVNEMFPHIFGAINIDAVFNSEEI